MSEPPKFCPTFWFFSLSGFQDGTNLLWKQQVFCELKLEVGLRAAWQSPRTTAMLPLLSPRCTAPKDEQRNTTLASVSCLTLVSPPRWPWPVLPVSPRATVMAHDVLLSIAEPPAESSIPARVVLHLWIVPLDFAIKPKTKCETLLTWMASRWAF